MLTNKDVKFKNLSKEEKRKIGIIVMNAALLRVAIERRENAQKEFNRRFK